MLRVWDVVLHGKKNKTTKRESSISKSVSLTLGGASLNIKFGMICSSPGHLSTIHKISVSTELNIIASASDSTMIVWDLQSLKCIHIYKFNEKIGDIAIQNRKVNQFYVFFFSFFGLFLVCEVL